VSIDRKAGVRAVGGKKIPLSAMEKSELDMRVTVLKYRQRQLETVRVFNNLS
jgi:hypothetical protein